MSTYLYYDEQLVIALSQVTYEIVNVLVVDEMEIKTGYH